MCLGAGILVSTAFGAGDRDRLEKQVSTTAIAGAAFSLGFSLLCILLAGPLLRLMQVPAAVLPLAVSYLRVVFGGLIFTFFYNFLAATLRALGDSKSALYFLMLSALLNILGDLFCVAVMGWGVEGAALSTVASEALCCLCCAVYIKARVPVLCLGRRWLVFEPAMLRQTVQYGWTTAMQQGTVQLGKIAIQAVVNTMGVNAMAAFAAASRVDDFAYTPQQNIGHAMTTLMAQNRGAAKPDRVRRGFAAGMRIEAVYGLAIMAVCFFGAGPIMRLFADEPEVVALGVRFLRLVSLLYLLPSATNGIQGGFRFAYTPQQNIGHAMTTLMAQNRGAAKADRVRRGFAAGMRIEAVYGLAIMAVCIFGAEPIMRLFADEPEVIALGVRFLRLVSLFYLLPSATNGIQGGFRGVERLQVTLNSSLLNMGGRVAAAALFVLVFHMDIEALPWSYAVGWGCMLLYELPLLFRLWKEGSF